MTAKKTLEKMLSLMIVALFVLSPMAILLQNTGANQAGNSIKAVTDLYITGTFVINENTIDPKTNQSGMYGQNGNITVANGGTLIVRNATLYFLSDNGNDNTNLSDDNHYWLKVKSGGTLIMENATLTVSDAAVHPYLKLPVTIKGRAILNNSVLAFPGSFTVDNGILYANYTTFRGLNSVATYDYNQDGVADALDVDDNDDCPIMKFINSKTVFADSKVENYYENTNLPPVITFYPSRKGAADTTGENIQNLSSSGVYYTVNLGEEMYIDGFNSSTALAYNLSMYGPVISAYLTISWAADPAYNGTNDVWLGLDGNPQQISTIHPDGAAGTQTIDLLSLGIDTIEEIRQMDVNFTHNGNNGSVPFDLLSIDVTPLYEFNITVDDGSFYAINTDFDLDFRDSQDVANQGLHDVLISKNGAEIRFYNVTVNETETSGHDDFVFLPQDTSEIYFYGWLNIHTIDGNSTDPTPVPYCRITPVYFAPSSDAINITKENNTLHNGDPVLEYLNRTFRDRMLNESNYNTTNASGIGEIPLLKDLITSSDLNGVFLGNYNVTAEEHVQNTNLSQQINFPPYPEIKAGNNTFNANYAFSWSYRPRDLAISPSDISIKPAPIVRGNLVQVTATIHNIGGINVTEPFDVNLLVDGTAVNSTTVTQMVERNNGTVNVSMGWQTVYGDYGAHEITVVVDPTGNITDDNRSNNNATVNCFVNALYDLSIIPLHIWWENTTYGNYTYLNLTVYANVTNEGQENISGNITVEFYVNGTLIGSDIINGISANSSAQASTTYTTSTSGNYNVSVNVKPPAGIEDDNMANNTAYRNLSTDPTPDLIINSITFNPNPVIESFNTTINATVKNTGETYANGTITVDFYDNTTGEYIGQSSVSTNLSAGSSAYLQIIWKAKRPVNISHTISTTVSFNNSSGKPPETNTGNNENTADITVNPYVDLSISDSDINITVTPGGPYTYQQINITAAVHNSGNETVGAFAVNIYVNGVLKGTTNISGMLAGTSVNVSATFVENTTGTCIIEVVVDANNQITEVFETNNTAFYYLNVSATPDLTIDSITFNPNPVIESFNTTINATVSNVGETYANGTIIVDFYDNTTGEHIGQSSVSTNLSAGASTYLQIVWKAKRPVNISHTISANVTFTPSGSNPPETNTENNSNTADILVEAYIDLSISDSDITVTPSNPYTYQQINVSAAVHNSGNESVDEVFETTITRYLGTNQVYVNYSGPWSGEITDKSGTHSYTGTGAKYFTVIGDGVSATFRKEDATNDTLVLEMIENGVVVRHIETIAYDGEVSTYYTFTNPGTKVYAETIYGLGPGQIYGIQTSIYINNSGKYVLMFSVDAGNIIDEVFEDNNIVLYYLNVSATPDLIINSITFIPNPVIESFNTTINATVSNVGETYANGTITVDFYDTTTGEYIGQSSVSTNLSAGSSAYLQIVWKAKRPVNTLHTISANVTFTPSGTNPPETNTGNNGKTRDIAVNPYVDLSISNSDITVTPANPYTYQQINVSATVHNSGNESVVDEFAVKIYVNSVVKGTTNISGMLVGASINVYANFTVEKAGTYTIKVVVDANKKITETSDDNNTAFYNVTVLPTPDLIISDMSASVEVVEYENVTITATVKNDGETYANGTITVDFYDNTTGIWIGNTSIVTNLSAGNSMDVSINWSAVSPEGNHTFYAVVSFINSTGDPPETNTANNSYYMPNPIYVKLSIDLAISDTDITYTPAAPLTYQNITVSAAIHNIGHRNITGQFTVEFLINTAPYYIAVNGLNAGESTTVSIVFSEAISATYTVTVKVDSTEAISEFDEYNNQATTTIYVGPRPEFSISSVTVLSQHIVDNHDVTLATGIKNTGASCTGTIDVMFYDGNPDAGGTLIGTRSYTDPAAGWHVTATYTWHATGVGSHTIYVRIVASTSPPEGDTTDNTAYLSVEVLPRPDLTITNMTFLRNGEIINSTSECVGFDVNITIGNIDGRLSYSGITSFTISFFSGPYVEGNWSNLLGNITFDNQTQLDQLDNGVPLNLTLEIPRFTLPAGTANIYAIVDLKNIVDESSESNNQFNKTVTILEMVLNVQISSPINGQSINLQEQNTMVIIGYVRDGVSNEPVPGIILHVGIRNVETGALTSQDAVSGKDGSFRSDTINLPANPGNYELVITAERPDGTALTPHYPPVSLSLQRPAPASEFPFWMVLLIGAIIVVAVVAGSMLALRRYALGKYVECGQCGKMIPAGSDKCPYCGAVFDKETVKCSVCGAWIPADATECPKCGAKFLVSGKEIVDYETQMKQQYEKFVEKFRKQAKEEMGKDYTENKFQQWWKSQKSYVTFEDWLKREEERKKTGGIICPVCGALNSKTDIVCHVCGSPLRPTKKKLEAEVIEGAAISKIELPSLEEEKEGKKPEEEKEEGEKPEETEETEKEEPEKAEEERVPPTEEKPPIRPVKKVIKKVVRRPIRPPEQTGKEESAPAVPEHLIGKIKKSETAEKETPEAPVEEKPPAEIPRRKVVKKVVRKKVVKK